MHLDDQAPPVAPWVVLLRVLARTGPRSTTKLGQAAQHVTEGRVARYLPSVLAMLRRLEQDGAVTSRKLEATRRTTIVWAITDEGRWLLDEALRVVRAVLDEPGGGTDEQQRSEQRSEQRREQR